ncbi:DNA transposase [Frankliniella fusca]|uniref:DNA transposase n=1 Tax=Frankliniella fusca TaxID=407009 RepID=A0AAE1LRK8_9NEOP|nr:DNA transposase [Frankliniella fusca]
MLSDSRNEAFYFIKIFKETLQEINQGENDEPLIEASEHPGTSTKENMEDELILCDWPCPLFHTICRRPGSIQRPNDNWHIHKGPDFVSYVHIETSAIQIDRYLKINNNEIKLYLLQNNIELNYSNPESFEDFEKLLQRVEELQACPGTGKEDGRRSPKCTLFLEPGGKRKRTAPCCKHCSDKRKSIAKGFRRTLDKKFRKAKNEKEKNNKIRVLTKNVISRNKKVLTLQQTVTDLKEKFASLDFKKLNEYIQNWPVCWQNAVLACVNAAKVKSSKGRRYTTQWIYECQLLRIKSLSLYKKMLRDGFLPLPSLRTLQRYMKKLSPAYGFQENTFAMLRERAPLMHESDRHGSLLVDEIKLSEGLWVDKQSLQVLGFVHLDNFTPEAQKVVPADHSLVMMFQGFKGQYFQSEKTHKIRKKKKKQTTRRKNNNVLEEEEDFIESESVSSCVHPTDNSRRLWFVSDFPHLVKSMKQRMVNAEELQTPDGPVKLKHWLIVVQEDAKRGIKAAPKLSMDHFASDTYAAMSVEKATSFFSEQAATAMEHYKKIKTKGMEDCDSTVKFIRRVNVLIDAMNSNTPSQGLKAATSTEEVMVDPPSCAKYLSEYESSDGIIATRSAMVNWHSSCTSS